MCWLATIVCSLLLLQPVKGATVERWVGPVVECPNSPGWCHPEGSSYGDGSSAANPAPFLYWNATKQRWENTVNDWLGDTGPADLTVHFLAGEFVTTDKELWITGGSSRSVTLMGTLVDGRRVSKIRLGSLQNAAGVAGEWSTSILHHWMIRSAKIGDDNHYLGRIVIEDLELDGGFLDQGAWTSAANATGYKSFAIDVAAKTGRIRNVGVRNFGSVGDVPASYLHQGGGVEAFPVTFHTYDTGQTAQGGDPVPWLVEKVEVTDFHSVHGGYATLIMPQVFTVGHAAYTQSPVALIRQCTIRNPEMTAIAFGTAKKGDYLINDSTVNEASFGTSGRIKFEDNVVLGSLIGFNTDTGAIGPLWFNNNAFLDLNTLGWVGQADSLPNHKRFGLTDNLVRLRGRINYKTWSDICISSLETATTDPNRALGVFEQREAAGLVVQGAAEDLRLVQNDFTTWPRDNFNLPAPTEVANAQFRVIWKLLSDTPYYCWLFAQPRPDVSGMTLTDNRISTVGYDFGGLTALSGNANYPTFGANDAPAYTGLTPAIAAEPAGTFTPQGTLGWVYRFVSNNRLTAVQELQIGDVAYDSAGSGTLTVKARLTKHQLRVGGSTGTVVVQPTGTTLRLKYERRNPDWTVFQSSVFTANTDANGIATFNLTGLNGVTGVCRLSVWQDVYGGTTGTLEPYFDVWASYDYPLAAPSHLPVVSLTATPDVGDDKNTAVVKRAKIQATRTGSTASELTVNVTLHTDVHRKPGSTSHPYLGATYGASGTGDYFINSGTATWNSASPYAAATITIPVGQPSGDVSIVTRADNLTEQNLIVCRLAASTAYAPGVYTNTDILIFDGPEYSFYDLTDYRPDTYGYQVPAALTVTGVNSAGSVQVSGWVNYPAALYPSTTVGGYWTTANPNNIVDVWGTRLAGNSPLPYGISDAGMLVGENGSAAFRRSGATQIALPHLLTSGGASAAYGVNPAGTPTTHYIVGKSLDGSHRPVVWVNSASVAVNLTAGFGTTDGAGTAWAVNDAGVVVGDANGFGGAPGGSSIVRPFRTPAGGVPLTQSDYLAVPSPVGSAVDHSGRASGIASFASKHHAVGRFRFDDLTPNCGCYWEPGVSGLPATPTSLGTLVENEATDFQSAATGINGALRAVGWSGPSAGHASRKAVFISKVTTGGAPWKNLNDKRFSWGAPSGWLLQESKAIGGGGAIVGVGAVNGQPRGFLLVPRTAGQ